MLCQNCWIGSTNYYICRIVSKTNKLVKANIWISVILFFHLHFTDDLGKVAIFVTLISFETITFKFKVIQVDLRFANLIHETLTPFL